MARLNREMMSSPTKVGEVARAKRGSEGVSPKTDRVSRRVRERRAEWRA
jgi:hypothetical protein